jgi:predicted mannosyl-3-phosphoglycerate phosphatase (HAD superfamily)
MRHGLPAFKDALTSDDEASQTFAWMGENYQGQFVRWINSAGTDLESRQRIQAAIDMLAGRDMVRRN